MALNNKPKANSSTDDSWKSAGFINIYVPTKDGGRRKLGAIGLRDDKEQEKTLREWLEADPANLAKLQAKLIVEYNSAEPRAGTEFDLG